MALLDGLRRLLVARRETVATVSNDSAFSKVSEVLDITGARCATVSNENE